MKNLTLVCFLCLYSLLSVDTTVQAQTVSDKFGQNTMQFDKQDWIRYLSPNFAISYTDKDVDLAKYVLPVIEADYIELNKLFEHKLRGRIEVVIYSDFSDYAQSNIGVERHIINNGGVTDTKKAKIKLYFDGNHNHLRAQIREGLATILLGKILSGTNLQEIVQNSVLMNLPKWFVLGAVGYAREDWNTNLDNQVRDRLLSGKYNDFLDFARKEPELAGHSLFHFVSEVHGKSTVSNLLYLTRVNRSVESGFLYVFGKTFYQVAGADWFRYYSSRYNEDNLKRRFPSLGQLDIDLSKNATIRQIKISPDSKQIAFVEHLKGVQKIWLFDIETNKKTLLKKIGEKDWSGIYDTNYPLINWAGSNQLIVISEKKDKVQLKYLNINNDKKEAVQTIPNLERVTSFSVKDRTKLLLIGIQNGQSDIYTYQSGGGIKAITNDFWDESEAIYATVGNQQGILFTSNRPQARLNALRLNNDFPMRSDDVFFHDLGTPNKELLQLTHTPLANESNLIALSDGQYSYLSNINGFDNRYVASLDSVLWQQERVIVLEDGTQQIVSTDTIINDLPIDTTYLKPVYKWTGVAVANTDYSRSILEQNRSANKMVDLFYRDGTYQIFLRDFKQERTMEAVKKTSYRQLLEKRYNLSTFGQLTLDENPARIPSPTLQKSTGSVSQKIINRTDAIAPSTIDTVIPPVDTSDLDINNYEFQNEFDPIDEPTLDEDGTTVIIPTELIEEGTEIKVKKKQNTTPQRLSESSKVKAVEWDNKEATPYNGLFSMSELVLQFDNTPMYNNMDMYLGGHYQYQPLSLLAKVRFEDIYEDFSIQLGVRMPFTFNGMEYFVDVENNKGLIDQRYSFYRRSRTQNFILVDTVSQQSIEASGRNIKHIVEGEAKYPLSKTQSLRGILGVQLEKVAIIADNISTLQVPILNRNNLHLRFEYVYDNTVGLRFNVRKGGRFKAYADFYKPFVVNTEQGLEIDASNGLTTALGFDGRYYHTFDDKTIFAFRVAGASSFGQKKILYSLGGVENWIFTEEEEAIPLPSTDNFGLQTSAANLRGFGTNARNGSSYLLGNFEIRIPVLSYLMRKTPRNAMWRNFQIVGFLDVGTAWQGLSPFSDDNPLSTTIIDNNGPNSVSPVRVIVNYYRRPILMSYGIGFRTVLLGHYIRLDYAVGVETGQPQQPRVHIAIGTDF